MRKIEIIIVALAGAGLMFAIVAEAAQKKIGQYGVLPATSGAVKVAAWPAQKDWQSISLDDEARLALAAPGGEAAKGEQNFEQIFKRLSRMETAAGPDTVDPEAAAQTVRRMGEKALSILNDGTLSPQMKQVKFQQLLARDFDLPLIARFALGRHWRTASEAEKQAYVDAFSRFILKSYAGQLVKARIKAFTVVSSRPAGKHDVMVQTQMERGGGGVLNLVWRMRRRNGEYRVIDVVAEGISLALTKRQEFAAIIRASGGQVSPLIDTLRSRAT